MSWTTIISNKATWPPQGIKIAVKPYGCKIADYITDCLILEGENLGWIDAWMTMEEWDKLRNDTRNDV